MAPHPGISDLVPQKP